MKNLTNTPTFATIYTKSWPYEIFMRRALGNKYEYERAHMGNLMDAEMGNRPNYLPPLPKQLEAIKKNMHKALLAYKKRRLPKPIIELLNILIIELPNSNNSHELLAICNLVIMATPNLKY